MMMSDVKLESRRFQNASPLTESQSKNPGSEMKDRRVSRLDCSSEQAEAIGKTDCLPYYLPAAQRLLTQRTNRECAPPTMMSLGGVSASVGSAASLQPACPVSSAELPKLIKTRHSETAAECLQKKPTRFISAGRPSYEIGHRPSFPAPGWLAAVAWPGCLRRQGGGLLVKKDRSLHRWIRRGRGAAHSRHQTLAPSFDHAPNFRS